MVWGQPLLSLGGQQLVAFAKAPTSVFYPLYEQVAVDIAVMYFSASISPCTAVSSQIFSIPFSTCCQAELALEEDKSVFMLKLKAEG